MSFMNSHKVRDDNMESMDLSIESRALSFQAFSESSSIIGFLNNGETRCNQTEE